MRKQKNGVLIESAGIYWPSMADRQRVNEFLYTRALKKGPFIARAILEKIEREQKKSEREIA